MPAGAIRVLPGYTKNTAEEVQAIAAELRRAGGERAIVVTSKYHTRRVKVLWGVLVGATPSLMVRFARRDPFQPGRWWKTTQDANAVSKEWFGVLNAWAGFPVKTR